MALLPVNLFPVTRESDLLVYYKMDDAIGSAVADSTPFGHDGNMSGMDNDDWVAGRFGMGLEFDGADDRVRIPTTVPVSIHQSTVSLWFKTAHSYTDAGHIYYGSTSTGADGFGGESEYHLNLISGSNHLQYFVLNGPRVDKHATVPLNDNQWHHIAAVNEPGNFTLYVDGGQTFKAVDTATPGIFNFTGAHQLGGPGANRRAYKGLVDEFRIYSAILSEAEVKAIYGNGHGDLNDVPVLTIAGESELTHQLGTPFTAPTATATDPEDGDLTGGIQILYKYSRSATRQLDLGAWWRFDHDFDTANLLGGSADFGGTQWIAKGLAAVTDNEVAIDKTPTADTLTEDSSTGTAHQVHQAFTASSGTTYTATVYAKAGTRTHLSLSLKNYSKWEGGGGAKTTFDLTNGTSAPDNSTPAAHSIEELEDGWYRCRITARATADFASALNLLLNDGSGTTYDGDGAGSLVVWGAQVEIGDAPTEYVNESKAQPALDSSEFLSHGTLMGDAKYVPGKFGEAVELDGSGDYVRIPHLNTLANSTTSITVSAWTYLNTANGASGSHVLDAGILTTDAGADQLILWFNADGSGANRPSYTVRFGDAATKHLAGEAFSPVAHQWQHVVTVMDKGTWKVYLDGVLQSTRAENPPGQLDLQNQEILIGAWSGTPNFDFDGKIDDVRLYNIALGDSEIAKIHGGGDGDLVAPDTGHLDTSIPGEWTLTYSVTDSTGNKVDSTVKVTVVDPEAPTLELEGGISVTHQQGTPWEDPGFVIKDKDGNPVADTSAIEIVGEVDPDAPGTYLVSYSFTDPDGHQATPQTRTVEVGDFLPPELTLSGPDTLKLQIGQPYVDPGFTATDTVDGEIIPFTSLMIPDHLLHRGSSPGWPEDAMNLDKNGGMLQDTPYGQKLFQTGQRNIGLYLDGDGDFLAAGVGHTSNDNYRNLFVGYFRAKVSGTYEFGCQNPDDRSAVWLDLDQDGVFELNGEAGNEMVSKGYAGGFSQIILEPGYYRYAVAHIEGTGHSRVDALFFTPPGGGPTTRTRVYPGWTGQKGLWFADNRFNTMVPGTHTITYTATDDSGNSSTLTRTVVVADYPDRPKIALNGRAVIKHPVGTTFTDPGGIVTDSQGTPLAGQSPEISGTVNIHAPGTYELEYNWKGQDGLAADTVTRVVEIADSTAPTLTLVGGDNIELILGEPYIEPGYVAQDNFDPVVIVGSSATLPSNGLWMHIDAGNIPGILDGETVPVWLDDSGNGNHMDPVHGSPTYSNSVLNGKPAVVFDGNSMMAVTNSVANIYSIFTVSQLEGSDNERLISSRTRNWVIGYNIDNEDIFYPEAWASNNGVPPTIQPHLYSAVSTGSSHTRFWGDGRDLTLDDSRNGQIGQLQLGGYFTDAQYTGAGYISEIVLYDRALSEEERLSVETRLATKYKLMGYPTHPLPDFTQVGDHTILYAARDSSGNTTFATRTVTIRPDPSIPVIHLTGSSELRHEAGSDFTDPGAVVKDGDGNTLDQSFLKTIGSIDTTKIGQQTLTYTYETEDLSAEPAIRKVLLVDTTPPAITLTGDALVELKVGDTYVIEGATATDSVEGGITPVLDNGYPHLDYAPGLLCGEISSNPMSFAANPGNMGVDPLGPSKAFITTKGTGNWRDRWTFVYTGQIYDADGLISFRVSIDDRARLTFDGKVLFDNTTSTTHATAIHDAGRGGWFDIEIRMWNNNGTAGQVTAPGFGYDASGGGTYLPAQNSDENTADLFRYPTPDPTKINTETPGTYTVTYTATDSHGNSSTAARTILVVPDDTTPYILLHGEQEVTIEARTIAEYTDPKAIAKAGDGSPLQDNIEGSGTVDTQTPGSYPLQYIYEAPDGTFAQAVTRTVHVVDSIAPELTLNGDAFITLTVGDTYTDAGATATDNLDPSVQAFSDLDPIPNRLVYNAYLNNFAEHYLDFDNNGGVIPMRPKASILFDKPIKFASDAEFRAAQPAINRNDNFQNLWMGNFNALRDGEYYFQTTNIDDRATIYLDKDKDGIFERSGDSGDERITYGTQGNPVFLLKGTYPIAIAHQEGGGSSRVTARFRTPEGAGPSTTSDIHPASPEQAGIWATRPLDLDTSVPGRHTITYYAEDSSGNLTTATRTIVVQEDPLRPVILLLGDANLSHEAGIDYHDAGVLLEDYQGNPLDESMVTVSNLPDGWTEGQFTITYEYTDADGHTADPVTRSITIRDTLPPVAELLGPDPAIVPVGEVFEDPGITATDVFDQELDISNSYTFPPGLILHLDAATLGGTLNDGDEFTGSWDDISGAGNHADNFTGNPVWRENGLNGLPVVEVDGNTTGGDGKHDLIWTTTKFHTITDEFTLITVSKYGSGARDRLFSTHDGRNWLFGYNDNGVGRFHPSSWVVNTGPSDQNWHLHIGSVSNTDLANFWRDGTQLATNSRSAHDTSHVPSDLQIGGWRGNSEVSSGSVAEVLMYDRVLEKAELLQLQSHLNGKYNLNGGGLAIQPIDTSTIGETAVQYSVSDDAGHLVLLSRTIKVIDPAVLPVIVLAGEAEVPHPSGTPFTDPGYTITDSGGTEIQGAQATVSSNLNIYKPGTYTVSYGYTDTDGNPAPTVTRKIVVTDQTPPVITLVGGEIWEHQIGNRWVDPGYAAMDAVDGNVDVINSYLAKGFFRGMSYDERGTQYLNLDNNGGYFLETPTSTVEYYSSGPTGEGLRVRGATAFRDAFEGITGDDNFGVMWVGHFHTETGGRYEFGIEQPDDRAAAWIDLDQDEVFEINGNQGDERVNQNYQYGYRTFDLKPGFYRFAVCFYEGVGGEHVQPRIRALSGKGPAALTWINPGAADQRDLWVLYNPFDINTPGEYDITYTSTDSAGNQSTLVRKVIVKNNPDAPVLTLIGEKEITLGIGETWADPGYTVADFEGNAIDTSGNPVQLTGEVAGHLGEYELRYDFTSTEGVPARTVVRIVTVADTTAPEVTLAGEAEITVFQGQPFTDPGATALDNYDGTLPVGSSQGVPEDGKVLHIDASNIAGVADGDVLPIWFDSSPSKSHLSLRGGDPIYNANGINGKPIVYFDGTSRLASENSFGNIYTIATVSRLHGVLDGRLVSSLNRNWFHGFHNGKMHTFHPEAWATSGSPDADTLPHLHLATSTGGNNVRFYADSVDKTVFRTRNGLIGQLQLGAYQGGNESSIGEVAEVVLFNRVLDSTERLSLEALLNAKYAMNGVPSGNVPVNLLKTGTYQILYQAVDGAGNIGTATRTVHVVPDPDAPAITLAGDPYIVQEAGTAYAEPGFTLSDKDGDLDSSLVEVDNPVNILQPGQYTITYNYKPEFTAHAPEVSRVVEIRDTLAPVISLQGDTYIKLEVGEAWTDPGYSAVDAGTGDIPVISDEIWVPNQMDHFVYTDGSNNDNLLELDQNGGIKSLTPVATEVFSTGPGDRGSDFNNFGEMKSPQGDHFQVLLQGKFFAPVKGTYQFGRIDLDGAITMWVDLDQDEVFELDGDNGNERIMSLNRTGWLPAFMEPGIYDIAVAYRESTGNERFEVRYTLPRGNVPYQNQRIRPVASAQLGLWATKRAASTVDTSTAGTYSINYTARDISGNMATAVRTIVVVDDASLPFVALKGQPAITHELGTPFTDPGATVTDQDDAVLEANLQAAVTLDISQLGEQTLSYEYSNATTVNRTVTVVDTTAPTATLTAHPTYGGTDTVTLLAKQEWVDPGLTITDADSAPWFISSRDYIPNRLLHAGFNFGGSVDFNNNGGFLAQTPTHTRFFTSGNANKGWDYDSDADFQRAGVGITNVDNYGSYALGYFHARVAGDYIFDTDKPDDDMTIWLDIDQNGIFEDPNLERLTFDTQNRTEFLTEGFYKVIIGHREGGGGSRGRARIQTPEGAGPSDALAIIKPAAQEQNGLWLSEGEGAIDTTFPGTHTITYYLMDNSGNTSTLTRTVIVNPDPDAPILALVGDAEITHEQGTPYTDSGVTIKNAAGTDLDPGPLTTTINQGGQEVAEVDISLPGLVTILYEYDDGSKSAIPLTRSVTIADTTAPDISLIGEATIQIPPGSKYVDAGVTATDAVDENLKVTATGEKLSFTFNLGSTLLDGLVHHYQFEEQSGNIVIDHAGDNDLTFTGTPTRGDALLGRGIYVNNNGTAQTPHHESFFPTEGVSISVWFRQSTEQADYTKLAVVNKTDMYPYGFAFAQGNRAFQFLATNSAKGAGNLTADNLLPKNEWVHALGTWDMQEVKLYINGDLQQDVKPLVGPIYDNGQHFSVGGRQHNEHRFRGDIDDVAIWSRALTQDEAHQLQSTTPVLDTRSEGEFTITYTATDDAGNSASITRTVIIKTDPSLPILTLQGDKAHTHEAGAPYEDPGALPHDSRDNPLDASLVTVAGTVDHSALGVYSLEYNFTNADGKDAIPVKRTVTVVDTTAPTIDLTGGTEYRVTLGTPEWADPGFTITDNLDTGLAAKVTLQSLTGELPVAHWEFDHDDGTVLKELYNGLDGTLMNFPDPVADSWVPGKYGHALQFDGVSNYVAIPGSALLDLVQFSVTAWVKSDAYDQSMFIFEKTTDDTVNSQYGVFFESGAHKFRLNDGSGGFVDASVGSVEFTANEWQHVASTYDGSIQSIYVGGELVAEEQQDVTPPVTPAAGPAYIGAYAKGEGYLFQGMIDDLKIYNTALDQGDVAFSMKRNGIDTTTATTQPYIIQYESTDSSGNTTIVQRKVHVSGDVTAPVITLAGEAEVSHKPGVAWVDPGYSATDNQDGNITPLVSITSSPVLDINTPGEYILTYNVSDAAFNKATPVTRKVIIRDPLVSWRLEKLAGVPVEKQGDLEDADNDRIPNLLEYALGGNPTQPDRAATLPKPQATSPNLALIFVRLKSSVDPDITYTAQITNQLKDPNSWTDAGVTVTKSSDQANLPDGKDAADSDYERYNAVADTAISDEQNGQQFLRLFITR